MPCGDQDQCWVRPGREDLSLAHTPHTRLVLAISQPWEGALEPRRNQGKPKTLSLLILPPLSFSVFHEERRGNCVTCTWLAAPGLPGHMQPRQEARILLRSLQLG